MQALGDELTFSGPNGFQFSALSCQSERKTRSWLTLFSRLRPNELSIVRHCGIHGRGKPTPPTELFNED
jgi:hypothetical protein